jgi:hypothetical protein
MTTTGLDSHCFRAYADAPLKAHQVCDRTEEGAHRGLERKYILNIYKKIKKCGANNVLIQKSILRDMYNKLHFWDTHYDGRRED